MHEMDVSSPRAKILTVNPLDWRNAEMYPKEMGGEAGAKGLISISRTFTVSRLIGNTLVTGQGKMGPGLLVAVHDAGRLDIAFDEKHAISR
jgi:hypothetical protein